MMPAHHFLGNDQHFVCYALPLRPQFSKAFRYIFIFRSATAFSKSIQSERKVLC